jgi:hypothetical protein
VWGAPVELHARRQAKALDPPRNGRAQGTATDQVQVEVNSSRQSCACVYQEVDPFQANETSNIYDPKNVIVRRLLPFCKEVRVHAVFREVFDFIILEI